MNNKPKKKLAIRIYEAFFPPKPTVRRSYAAARVNRLNADWTTTPTGANYEIRMSLSQLIARSRQAARDFLHIVNYLRLMRAGVVGQYGIGLQSTARTKTGELDLELNERVEYLWWEWCHAESCTVSGKLNWKGVQDLAVTQGERDGAFLIQMIDNAKNDFGFALKVWDVTWLDFTYNETLANGNRIIMSVELDANDKPVAYWLTTPASEFMFVRDNRRQRSRVRIPAEQIIHGVQIFDDESQVHGVPGVTPALLPVKNAYSYSESVVLASRLSANQFATLKNTQADAEVDWDVAKNEDGTPNHPLIDSAPLSITPLLPGWELDQFKPDHPTQNHPAFKETLDMDIAVGLGVPYFLLMGNWKAVNFSSSRGGLGEFRERLKCYHEFISATLCRPIYHAWLRAVVLSGKLKVTQRQFAELQNPTWQPRGFSYVDPEKDAKTDALQLQNRLVTPSEILAERGVDYIDHLKRWERDKALAASHGIDIDVIYTQKSPAAQTEPDDDDAEGKSKKAKGKTDDEEDDDKERAMFPVSMHTNGHATHVE